MSQNQTTEDDDLVDECLREQENHQSFQEQLEKVREEAFNEGYAKAISDVRNKLAQMVPEGLLPPILPDVPKEQWEPKPPRGTNALLVQHVLKAGAPKAMGSTEIQNRIKAQGHVVASTSIRHAIDQLEKKGLIKEENGMRVWRYVGEDADEKPGADVPGPSINC